MEQMQAKAERDHPVPGSENELESEAEQQRKAKGRKGKAKGKAKCKPKARAKAKAKGKAAAKAKGRAAAKAKGKAKAKAKGRPKAKATGKAAAKTKSDPAKPAGKTKTKAKPCVNREDVETDAVPQGSRDVDQESCSNEEGAKRKRGRSATPQGVSKKPAASKAVAQDQAPTAEADKGEDSHMVKRQAATFARRNQPSTDPAKKAWNALRNAYRARVVPRVSSPSLLEDCLWGMMRDNIKTSSTCLANRPSGQDPFWRFARFNLKGDFDQSAMTLAEKFLASAHCKGTGYSQA